MTDKLETPRPSVVSDAPHAPFVYFDAAPTFGIRNGVVQITLAAAKYLPSPDGGVISEVAAVAYLRCNVRAAVHLREAIDKALLAIAKPEGQAH